MITLVIETSSPSGSLCLLKNEKALELFDFKTNENFSQRIFPLIQTLLSKNNLSLKDLELIAVNKGPGSYTGIRVGITAANTLSWANQIPIVGVSALRCMLDHSDLKIGQNIAVSYASQVDCFVAKCHVDEKGQITYEPDTRMTWGELEKNIVLNPQISYFSSKNPPPIWLNHAKPYTPSAEFIGKSALHLFNTDKQNQFGSVLPNYLKDFEVTPKRSKA